MNRQERMVAGVIVGERMQEAGVSYKDMLREMSQRGVQVTERTLRNMRGGRIAAGLDTVLAAQEAMDAIELRRTRPMTADRLRVMTPERVESYRIAASELLAESIVRGDQDDATIGFAVGFLLRRADSVTKEITA